MLRTIGNIYDISVSDSPISTIESGKGKGRNVLSFSSSERNSGKIVYCNYPEFIGPTKGMAFAKYSYCPNRQTVGPGEVQVFFSHHNRTGKNLWYGIQIYNPSNTTSAYVTLKNWGFGKTFDQTISPVEAFLTTTQEDPREITHNGVWWVLQQQIPASSSYTPFCGIIRFYVNRAVTVTSYVYENISEITGNEVVFPYSTEYADDLKVYSGYGNGFILNKTIDLNIGNMQSQGDVWYYTGEPSSWGRNVDEITPIYLVGENKVAKPDSSDPNLTQVGNWTTQYDFTINVTNNTGSSKRLYGFISGNSKGSNPVISADGKIKGWQSLGAQTRRWFNENIPTGVSTYKFTYMQASYGAAATNHAWSLSSTL